MSALVYGQTRVLVELCRALVTMERSFTGVGPLMSLQVTASGEGLLTLVATIRPLARMNPHVVGMS